MSFTYFVALPFSSKAHSVDMYIYSVRRQARVAHVNGSNNNSLSPLQNQQISIVVTPTLLIQDYPGFNAEPQPWRSQFPLRTKAHTRKHYFQTQFNVSKIITLYKNPYFSQRKSFAILIGLASRTWNCALNPYILHNGIDLTSGDFFTNVTSKYT